MLSFCGCVLYAGEKVIPLADALRRPSSSSWSRSGSSRSSSRPGSRVCGCDAVPTKMNLWALLQTKTEQQVRLRTAQWYIPRNSNLDFHSGFLPMMQFELCGSYCWREKGIAGEPLYTAVALGVEHTCIQMEKRNSRFFLS